MSFDDYEVVMYKVLTYCYECIKAGVEPSIDKAKEIAKVNDLYWGIVFKELLKHDYLTATVIPTWGETIYRDVAITAKGAEYLKDNSKMNDVRQFLGKAFVGVIDAAIKATMAI